MNIEQTKQASDKLWFFILKKLLLKQKKKFFGSYNMKVVIYFVQINLCREGGIKIWLEVVYWGGFFLVGGGGAMSKFSTFGGTPSPYPPPTYCLHEVSEILWLVKHSQIGYSEASTFKHEGNGRIFLNEFWIWSKLVFMYIAFYIKQRLVKYIKMFLFACLVLIMKWVYHVMNENVSWSSIGKKFYHYWATCIILWYIFTENMQN